MRAALLLVALAFASALASGCGSRPAGRAAAPSPAPLHAYEVLRYGPDFAALPAEVWMEVLVRPPVTQAELRRIAEDVVYQARARGRFSTLVVFFHDRRDLADYGGPSLGAAYYGSAFGTAEEPGAWWRMHFDFELKTKDWSERPSARDVRVYRAYVHECRALADPLNGLFDERSALRETAQRLRLDEEAVVATVAKVRTWTGPPQGVGW